MNRGGTEEGIYLLTGLDMPSPSTANAPLNNLLSLEEMASNIHNKLTKRNK